MSAKRISIISLEANKFLILRISLLFLLTWQFNLTLPVNSLEKTTTKWITINTHVLFLPLFLCGRKRLG